jgi:hypothetical protein
MALEGPSVQLWREEVVCRKPCLCLLEPGVAVESIHRTRSGIAYDEFRAR